MAAWLAILVLIIAAIALLVSHDAGTVAGMSTESFARLVAALAILVFLGGAVMSSYRGRVLEAIKHLLSWVILLFGLITLYAYRGELSVVAYRVIDELQPQGSQVNVTRYGMKRAVRIEKSWSGHFVATVRVAQQEVDMIVDTGASTVVLRHEDAKLLGINTRNLHYSVPVQTANGSSYAARVELQNVFIGDIGMKNVEALIAKPGNLHQSLLGMSFLSRLHSYEFTRNFLELRG